MSYKNRLIFSENIDTEDEIITFACFSAQYGVMRGDYDRVMIPSFPTRDDPRGHFGDLTEKDALNMIIVKDIDIKKGILLDDNNGNPEIKIDDAIMYLTVLKEHGAYIDEIKVVDDVKKYGSEQIRIKITFPLPVEEEIDPEDEKTRIMIMKYVLTLMFVRALYENYYSVAAHNAIEASKIYQTSKIGLMEWISYFMRDYYMNDKLHAPREYNSRPVYLDFNETKKFYNHGEYFLISDQFKEIEPEVIEEMSEVIKDKEVFYNSMDYTEYCKGKEVFKTDDEEDI